MSPPTPPLSPTTHAARPWLLLLGLSYLWAWACGSRLDASVWPVMALLLATGLGVHARQRTWRCVSHLGFILLGAGLALHLLPGFDNLRVALPPPVPGAPNASFHLNLDKPLIGLWLLLACPWVARTTPRPACLRATLLATPLTIAACLGAGWALGMLAWAPGWPANGGLWVINNLLLVCITEEVLFRGYLLGSLQRRWPTHPGVTLLASALLFGLAHAGGGMSWVVLGTLAGVGYGWAYRHGGLAAAVTVHFLVNLAHLSGWTYPMLPAAG